MKNLTILALFLGALLSHADTPAPGTVKAKVYSGNGLTPITSTGAVGSLDVNVTSSIPATVTSSLGSPVFTQTVVSGAVIDPRARTWSLLNSTDSVTAFQGGAPWMIGLPTGASTSALQTTGNSTLASILSALGSPLAVTVGNFPATQPISAASLPLPANAAIETGGHLASLNTKVTTTANGVKVDNSGVVQPVSGAVSVSNFPAAQAVNVRDGAGNSIGSTTGSLNVNMTNASATNPSVSTTGVAVPASATFIGARDPSANLRGLMVNVGGGLQVDGSAVTQPVSGTVSVSNFPATQPVSAVSLPLPTNASQETGGNLATVATKTSSLDTRIKSGQQTMANSIGVVVALDQTAIPVSGSVSVSNFPATQPVSGTVTANQGTANTASNAWPHKLVDSAGVNVATVSAAGALKVDGSAVTQPISATSMPLPSNAAAESGGNLAAINGKLNSLGQKVMTGSVPVVVSSDQSPISTKIFDSAGASILLGQQLSTASLPVVLTAAQISTLTPLSTVTVTQATGTNLHTVVDSGSITVPGVATAANQVTGNASLSSIDSKLGAGPVAQDASVMGLQVSQGSTTSGQKGGLGLGAVTTAAPAYTTAQTSPMSLTTAGALRTDASATTQPVSAASLPLPAGAATSAKQPALGTAGTASADVITVQGIASMTPLLVNGSGFTQPISGSVSVSSSALPLNAAQETGGNLASIASSATSILSTQTSGAQKSQRVDGSGNVAPAGDVAARKSFIALTDGTNTAAVKAASTATLAADPSAVVALSPNSPLPTGSNNVGSITNVTGTVSLPTGAATSANQSTAIANQTNGTHMTRVTDGTNTAAVKAASTAAVASDPSLVVGLSPNSALPTGANTIGSISNISGTVSLPTGASTSAIQTSGAQKAQVVDGAGAVQGPVQTISGTNYAPVVLAASATPGAALVARSIQIAGSDGTNAHTLSTNSSGHLNVNNVSGTVSLPTGAATETSLAKLTQTQGSTTSGQSGPLIQGAVTTAAPTYTTAQTSPLSLDTAGFARVVTKSSGSTGSAVPATANFIAGTDGTNLRGITTDTTGNLNTVGNVASAATDSGNPLKIGGKYNSTAQSLTSGQRGDAQLDKMSNLRVNTGGRSFVSYNTAQTGTVIKSGAGRLVSVCLMTKGANTDTLQLWDNTAASGTIISETTLTGTAMPLQCARLDLDFATGLTITTVGGTSRWTIIYE